MEFLRRLFKRESPKSSSELNFIQRFLLVHYELPEYFLKRQKESSWNDHVVEKAWRRDYKKIAPLLVAHFNVLIRQYQDEELKIDEGSILHYKFDLESRRFQGLPALLGMVAILERKPEAFKQPELNALWKALLITQSHSDFQIQSVNFEKEFKEIEKR